VSFPKNVNKQGGIRPRLTAIGCRILHLSVQNSEFDTFCFNLK